MTYNVKAQHCIHIPHVGTNTIQKYLNRKIHIHKLPVRPVSRIS